jgi:hypothetical protein
MDAPAGAGDAASADRPALADGAATIDVGSNAPDAAAAADSPPPCQAAELRVTEADGDSTYPSLVFTGSEYGVAWEDNRTGAAAVYFARLGRDGRKIGGDAPISPGSRPSLVWTGSGYGLAYADTRMANNPEIYFVRLDAAGRPVGQEVRVTNAPMISLSPSLAWTGKYYGVAWHDQREGNFDIFFARIGEAGVKSGDDVRITQVAQDSFRPSLVADGEGYGLAWNDNRDGDWEIYFASLDAAGTKRAPEKRVTSAAGPSLFPQLVRAGEGYGLVWNDTRDGKAGAFFRRLDIAGAAASPEVSFGSGAAGVGYGGLAATGTGFALTFDEPRGNGGPADTWLARLDAAGAAQGMPARVVGPPGAPTSGPLVWADGGFSLAFGDTRHGKAEIYFARVCP